MHNYSLGAAGQEKTLSGVGLAVTLETHDFTRETRLASARLVRDRITSKRQWTFTYTSLPGKDDRFGLGRNSMRLLYDTGGTLTLKVPVEGALDPEAVDVMFAETFSEQRVRAGSSAYLWNISFALTEV